MPRDYDGCVTWATVRTWRRLPYYPPADHSDAIRAVIAFLISCGLDDSTGSLSFQEVDRLCTQLYRYQLVRSLHA